MPARSCVRDSPTPTQNVDCMPTRRIRFVIPKDATGEEALRVIEEARRLTRRIRPAARTSGTNGPEVR